jgi:hypothetical protein
VEGNVYLVLDGDAVAVTDHGSGISELGRVKLETAIGELRERALDWP